MFWNKKTAWNLETMLIIALSISVMVGSLRADYFLGTPTLVPNINSGRADWGPSVSSDGLQIYFCSNRSGGSGNWDLWVSARATTEDEWEAPLNLGPPVNSSYEEGDPSISSDGLELYFDSKRADGSGGSDLWVSRRATTNESWGPPENLGSTVNSSSDDMYPCISSDGLELYFNCSRDWGLYVTRRAAKDKPWGPPVMVPGYIIYPNMSADGCVLLFGNDESGGYGSSDLWVRMRATIEEDWGTAINLGPTVNGPSWDAEPSLSADGRTLYFTSDRGGGSGSWDTWQVRILPIVDLNGDGIVDSGDMTVMVNHWGTNEPLCDIGPTPFGDGTVDVKDLILLSEHLFEQIDDPTLVAHWSLDETEGSIAHESVSGNADLVVGDAVWQPTGGLVGGALELDGVDDCIITGFGLNLADGPFSIFAWVKGGGPGQVVISEPMGTNWLVADVEGKLMTELKSASRDSTALLSQTVITDSTWHRIGLVWDGSQRMLCVDGVKVAEDTQASLETFDAGLYIGVGSDYAPGSLFSGMIDDVRIYNRAVSP